MRVFSVALLVFLGLPIAAAIAQQISAHAASPFGKTEIIEHNGNCKNKHRLRHNSKYRKHCKEEHGVELNKK